MNVREVTIALGSNKDAPEIARLIHESFVEHEGRLKAAKPDEAAFERAASRLDAAPHGLLLLDDDPTNVESARRYGWNAQTVSCAADVVARSRSADHAEYVPACVASRWRARTA